jgi:predicted Zn finger-like uncharacterized protein
MTERSKTVVCTSCSAKFHVPDELIRGKLVKFRCRKCGSAIDVDGRSSARPPAALESPPKAEITAVDTPATFSQRTLPPPPRPPIGLTKSSPNLHAPNLHPWPEPPRTRSTTAPIAISESTSPEESLPRLETVRDPSNRAPKIAAFVALLIAAGLSVFGLAMRGTPGESHGPEQGARPGDPTAAARALPAGEGNPNDRSSRAPTRVTDLPPAEGADPATTGATAEKQEPEQAPLANAIPAVPGEAPTPSPAGASEPGSVNGPLAAPTTAVPAPAPVAPSPAPAARGKGDFNTQAAREAMEDAAGRAGKCRNIDTPSGTARVAVTFAPNGHVTNAIIESGPFVGTTAGTCVATKFRAAKVPPFSGDSVIVRKTVPF